MLKPIAMMQDAAVMMQVPAPKLIVVKNQVNKQPRVNLKHFCSPIFA
jgi:hypothetical protein